MVSSCCFHKKCRLYANNILFPGISTCYFYLPIYNLNQKSALVDRQSRIWTLNTNEFAIQVLLLLLQPLIQLRFAIQKWQRVFFSINQTLLLSENDSFQIGLILEQLNQKQNVLHAVIKLALDSNIVQKNQVVTTTGCSIDYCNLLNSY